MSLQMKQNIEAIERMILRIQGTECLSKDVVLKEIGTQVPPIINIR